MIVKNQHQISEQITTMELIQHTTNWVNDEILEATITGIAGAVFSIAFACVEKH